MPEPIISTESLTMAFGGHLAVDHVSIKVRPYSFTSIIGPNGAGKTTFFNLLSGQLKPSEGRVFYKGQDVTGIPAHRRTKMGMGRSFQLTNLFPNLTVLENVRLAVQARENIGYKMFTSYLRLSSLREEALQLLQRVKLEKKVEVVAASLPHGEKRKLELAVILALKPDILLLDEPTAGMSVEEVPVILDLLSDIKQEGDKTILLVEHKMDVVLSLSDEIVVLFNGSLLAQGDPDTIMQNRQVQQAYLGGVV